VFYKGLIEIELKLLGAQKISNPGFFVQNKTLKEPPKFKTGVRYTNLEIQ
jgi:hypothetical protein